MTDAMSEGEMITSHDHGQESEESSFPLYLVYFAMLTFNVTVTIPISSYYCYRILHQDNDRIFHKRYPKLTIACVLAFLIIHLLLKPICDLPKFFDLDIGFDSKYLYPYFGYLPWALILVRGWYLFYDYNQNDVLWSSYLYSNPNNTLQHYFGAIDHQCGEYLTAWLQWQRDKLSH